MHINDHNPLPIYHPASDRYDQMNYRRTGKSGLLLPEISLGLWHNFGHNADFTLGRKILRRAFDLGISHFDLANNYGPPYGSAEENFGRIFKKDFLPFRDELIISSKAGWDMWPGPYGNMGSRKYLIASCDQSLKRMGLDYVDIFYHHRPDPETPLEETMGALDQLVRQGKALYVGISQYSAEDTARAYEILKQMGTPLLIHQPRYSMIDRWVEGGLLDVLGEKGIGSIAFSPLEQGMLTDKYLKGIPEDSRAAKDGRYLKPEQIGGEKLEMIRQLNDIAKTRNQTLAQMAIAWLLKDPRITSVLVGVSKPEQLDDNVSAIKNTQFSESEVAKIKEILGA
ncbi:L-glyceraldehyde 3-phosphate reductase [Algoriphagus zhangzhouensis]|uniref:L-glyceraldehyde 3-phosphate reductase n=1 Tax=Algoriphagus zhangzhouensis TaxID=1073327 RepID=A0A1M7Z6Z3_9BACT|nr:L-glyceraldehyde 3-phosphate reductase [Algoriphagus zhangzhouensis]TDY49279.1 L-glyceraldehyde 3-phosphate reductase [Algoriphagus zhangzhouensis]SHO60703.1 L-glyceraldehyde 3-phosphate reductase [Algoriphagus zhangzhouensis]